MVPAADPLLYLADDRCYAKPASIDELLIFFSAQCTQIEETAASVSNFQLRLVGVSGQPAGGARGRENKAPRNSQGHNMQGADLIKLLHHTYSRTYIITYDIGIISKRRISTYLLITVIWLQTTGMPEI